MSLAGRPWFFACILPLAACQSISTDQLDNQLKQAVTNKAFEASADSKRVTPSPDVIAAYDALFDPIKSNDDLNWQVMSSDAAVAFALKNNAGLRAKVFDFRAQLAVKINAGRLPNPTISWERASHLLEVNIARAISIDLLDFLLQGQRRAQVQAELNQAYLQIQSDILSHAMLAREAWIDAVYAGQTLTYLEQVTSIVELQKQLMERRLAAGHVAEHERIKAQLDYNAWLTKIELAQNRAMTTKRRLASILGTPASKEITLPEHLPNVPEQLNFNEQQFTSISQDRLDLALAKARIDSALKNEKIESNLSYTELGFKLGRGTEGQEKYTTRELEIQLPVFNWGEQKRAALSHQIQSAIASYQALATQTSHEVKSQFDKYQLNWRIARRYHDEVLPLRKQLSRQMLLRYNAMYVGVNTLLEGSRDTITMVMDALEAERNFWQADLNLKRSQLGINSLQSAMDERASSNSMSSTNSPDKHP